MWLGEPLGDFNDIYTEEAKQKKISWELGKLLLGTDLSAPNCRYNQTLKL